MIHDFRDLLGAMTVMRHPLCLANDRCIIGLFVAAHALASISYTVIGSILFFDRAAATRAMFDNRLAYGAFIIVCGLGHIAAAITVYEAVYWLSAVILLAICIVSVAMAWLTIQTFRVRRAAPA